MSESGDYVVLSSGDEEGSADEIVSKLAGVPDETETCTGSVADAEALDDTDDTDLEDDDSDCAIVSVDEEVHGEQKWRQVNGPMRRLNSLLRAGYNDPRILLKRIFNLDTRMLPEDPNQLWGLLISLFSEPEPRRRLKHINSVEKVIELLADSKNILVVTGAGVSVSCGIPDFRSRDGIYARLARDYPDLSSPQAMFDLAYFLNNPEPFFKFAKEIFPGQFTPSLTHWFVAVLEQRGQLLRNYTQNIDTLEQEAGITRLIQCHGSFATASCTTCKYRVPGAEIKEDIISQTIPRCPKCNDKIVSLSDLPESSDADKQLTTGAYSTVGVMKPDIVFFGEDLSAEFHDTLAEDIKKADFVLVIGSSLKVRPVAHIPNAIPEHVPQILINRESLANHKFDVELLGDCDVIVQQLCLRLGWELPFVAPESISSDRNQPKETSMFSYVPFTELPDCPVKLKEQSMGAAVSHPSSQMVDASVDKSGVECMAHSATSETTQKASDGAELEPKGAGNSGDHPVEITDSDDDEETEEDMWMVAPSLPADCFTMISSNQYVFPGAEVSVCRSAPLRLDDTESEYDCSDTSGCGNSSSASSPSRVDLVDKSTIAQQSHQHAPTSSGGGDQQASQYLFGTCVRRHAAAGSSRCSSPQQEDNTSEGTAGQSKELATVSTSGKVISSPTVSGANDDAVGGVAEADADTNLPSPASLDAVCDRTNCEDVYSPVEKRVRRCDSVVD